MAPAEKVCSVCRRCLPLSAFPSKGTFTRCRECHNAIQREARRIRNAGIRVQTCACCGQETPVASMMVGRLICRPCYQAQDRERRLRARQRPRLPKLSADEAQRATVAELVENARAAALASPLAAWKPSSRRGPCEE